MRALVLLLVLFSLVNNQQALPQNVPTLSYDKGYQQAVSERLTFGDRAPIGAWGVLAPLSSDIVGAVASHQVPGGVYLLSATTGLFFFNSTNVLTRIDDVVHRPPDGPAKQLALDGQTRLAAPASLSGGHFQWDIVIACTRWVARCHLRHTEKGTLSLECPNYQASAGTTIALPKYSQLTDVAMSSSGDVWLATDTGLWHLPSDGTKPAEREEPLGNVRIERLSVCELSDKQQQQQQVVDVAAVTAGRLVWRARFGCTGKQRSTLLSWQSWYLSENVTALAFLSGNELWIGGEDEAIFVQDSRFVLRSFSGHQRPYGKVNSIAQHCSDHRGAWLGTPWGLMRYDRTGDFDPSSSWRYMNGPRWLPTSAAAPFRSTVRFICATTTTKDVAEDQVVVVTDVGVARISIETWTLERKAKHMQSLMEPRHEYYGLAFDCQLRRYGNLSSCQSLPDDNAGLWTSVYLASQVFRYAVTHSREARDNANHALQALRFLQRVTGTEGYPARCYARKGDQGTDYNPYVDGDDTWFDSPSFDGWVYKSGTPSEELVGHQFALVAFYKLVAEFPEEQQLVRQLVVDITDRLLRHNLSLVTPQGTASVDGQWHPARLGTAQFVLDRELRSLQLLTWLTAAHFITQNSSYLDVRQSLLADARFDLHMINQRIGQFGDVPDALVWLLYSTWLLSEPAPNIEAFWLSINRTVEANLQAKLSTWNVLYLTLVANDHARRSDIAEELTWALETWPLEQIDWPIDNSQRLDIVWNVADETAEDGVENRLRLDELALEYLDRIAPKHERHFQHHDHLMAHGGTGFREKSPATWLLSYWMSRFCGLFTPRSERFEEKTH